MWLLTKPGITTLSPPSIVAAPSQDKLGPTPAIFPSLISRVAHQVANAVVHSDEMSLTDQNRSILVQHTGEFGRVGMRTIHLKRPPYVGSAGLSTDVPGDP